MTEEESRAARAKCEAIFAMLERELRGAYFGGDTFGLVDIAFAPALHRLVLVERRMSATLLAGFPKVDAWARRIAERPSVGESVDADFAERYVAGIRERGGWIARVA
jgi:glutathione S-transferase